MRSALSASVVIPAYNAERFLAETVDSVLRQTAGEFHMVVVDDGSTDRTLDIARSFQDPRITVVTGPNRGPAAARNIGWMTATPSRYVAFLDADDTWDPEKLARQITYLDQDARVVGVGCFMRYISSRGTVLGRTGQELGPEDLRKVARGELFPFPMSSLLVRRESLEAVGGFDEVFRHAGSEDLDCYARLASAGRLECIPEMLGSYRVHPESVMARSRTRINMEARFVRNRISAREKGLDLSWSQFAASYRPTWRERREDFVNILYRSAALWYGERKWLRAAGFGALAFLTAPGYTLRRASRQRLSLG